MPEAQTAVIQAGDRVIVTDAFGDEHEMLALSGIESPGHSFPIVWVRGTSQSAGERIPWPAESLRLRK